MPGQHPSQKAPDGPNGAVRDAARGNWVDRFAPPATRPYLRLSRADRPIGTWLLLLPCWWGLALAMISDQRIGQNDLWIALVCAAGAWLMRGAGCTWNDITDRNFDARVARTRSRPLPSGQVSLRGAYVWMGVQALTAAALLFTLNPAAIWLGLASLGLVALYPFAKRFTWWPQVFLGLAFNWGALLAWAAHQGQLALPALLLYAAGIAWTLFYDTIYAHQDTEDDALIGVKSTARLFAERSPIWLERFLIATVTLMGLAVALAARNTPFLTLPLALCAPWAMGLHLYWQLRRFNPQNPDLLLRLFQSNRTTGLIPLAVLLSALALAITGA